MAQTTGESIQAWTSLHTNSLDMVVDCCDNRLMDLKRSSFILAWIDVGEFCDI